MYKNLNTFMIDEQDPTDVSSGNGGYSSGNLWLTGIVAGASALGAIVGGSYVAFKVMQKNGMVQVSGEGGESDV